ncbi:MAG: CapA family protein [Betaproteobacteria bacterium]|nr:CapA family protein [Betaproteobacteria bacterium]
MAALSSSNEPAPTLTILLCGDVMTGRGIDQILAHPSDPGLREFYVTDARAYVTLAERAHGPIAKPADASYIWGEALGRLRSWAPDVRVINLETSITRSQAWENKGIHYRMHPANSACLAAAGIDCCMLANNHVLDFGREGLVETLEALHGMHIATAGAGRTLHDATAPAILDLGAKGRVLIFGFGCEDSGIPGRWAARPDVPGVNWLADLSERSLLNATAQILAVAQPSDITIASIHWGSNWGYGVEDQQRRFAQRLVADAGVQVVHGHSSHHAKGIEIFRGCPIFYGCGDFMNDYEGIGGHEAFRPDLVLMYRVVLDLASRRLSALTAVPFAIRRFRLRQAAAQDAQWLATRLDRESQPFGTQVGLNPDHTLSARAR